MPEIDLDELAAWARAGRLVPGDIRPSDLQRRYRLTFSQACTALEALEARGDLERIPGSTLAWRPVPPDPSGALSLFKPDGRRLSIILSDKEHAALLRALEERRHTFELLCLYEAILREMRTFAAALPHHEIARWVQRLDSERDAYAAEVGRSPEVPSPDATTLRSLRSKLEPGKGGAG